MSTNTGAAAMIRELRRIQDKLYIEIRNSLVLEASDILYRSQHEFVPIDEGDLFDSGKVTITENGKNLDNLQVTISYGDNKTAARAVAVHETPSGYDPPTWQGKEITFTTGGPKYLERPLLDAENGMIQRHATRVKLA